MITYIAQHIYCDHAVYKKKTLIEFWPSRSIRSTWWCILLRTTPPASQWWTTRRFFPELSATCFLWVVFLFITRVTQTLCSEHELWIRRSPWPHVFDDLEPSALSSAAQMTIASHWVGLKAWKYLCCIQIRSVGLLPDLIGGIAICNRHTVAVVRFVPQLLNCSLR